MNEQDKAAFDAAFSEYKAHVKPEYESYLNGWFDCIEHRDKQAAQAEPVGEVVGGIQINGEQAIKCYGIDTSLCVGAKIYTEAPAVAHPPADVVRELVEAFRQAQNALILANEKDVGPIVDTIWMPGGTSETLFDFFAKFSFSFCVSNFTK